MNSKNTSDAKRPRMSLMRHRRAQMDIFESVVLIIVIIAIALLSILLFRTLFKV